MEIPHESPRYHTSTVYTQFETMGDADFFEPLYLTILERHNGYHDGTDFDMHMGQRGYFALFESSRNAKRFTYEVKHAAALDNIDMTSKLTAESSPDQPSTPLS
jgi:hypothetical protein